MAGPTARFVVHGELADLLSADERRHLLVRPIDGTSTVKHVVSRFGVPHTGYGERHIILPGRSANPASNRDSFSTPPGTLAKYLRLLGFDVAYDNAADDDELLVRCPLRSGHGLSRPTHRCGAPLPSGRRIRPYTRCIACTAYLNRWRQPAPPGPRPADRQAWAAHVAG